MKRVIASAVLLLVVIILVGCGAGGSLDGWEEDPVLSFLGKNREDIKTETGRLSALGAIHPVLPKEYSVGFFSKDGVLIKAESMPQDKWSILGIRWGMKMSEVEKILGRGESVGSKEEIKMGKTLGLEQKRYEASGNNGHIRLDIIYSDDKVSRFIAYWAPR